MDKQVICVVGEGNPIHLLVIKAIENGWKVELDLPEDPEAKLNEMKKNLMSGIKVDNV